MTINVTMSVEQASKWMSEDTGMPAVGSVGAQDSPVQHGHHTTCSLSSLSPTYQMTGQRWPMNPRL